MMRYVFLVLLALLGTLRADDLSLDSYFDDIVINDLVDEEVLSAEAPRSALPKQELAPSKSPSIFEDRFPRPLPIREAGEQSVALQETPEENQAPLIEESPSDIQVEILPKLPKSDLAETLLPERPPEIGHSINFNDVPMEEFIRYVSKISEVNFIFDKKELNFNVSLTSGKVVTAENVLSALLRILRMNGFWIKKEDEYYVIHKIDPKNPPEKGWDSFLYEETPPAPPPVVVAPPPPPPVEVQPVEETKIEVPVVVELPPPPEPLPFEFFVYKLKYHQGAEIKAALKQIAIELQVQPGTPQKLLSAIQTVQWVQATNSLLCSGDKETIESLKRLIDSVDTALKQVFIEVLVIETDVSNGLEFGLQWGVSGQVKNGVGFGANMSPAGRDQSSFSKTLQGINATNTPSGLGQFPVGSGFDLGVIGDIIFHKGRSFLSLGSLVSALQQEGESTIVLNQKIIAQDNKPSKIFVGDNIPFTGSVTQLVGQNQQTTSNIEYRDIGVNLNITPMIGDDGVVTLDLNEEISETVNQPGVNPTTAQASGIRTTKTNMVTHVHVPDKHFLVLSGMIRNAKSTHKTGLPCLGGIPLIGSLFSKKVNAEEKRNVIIFVRPHIVRGVEDYKKVTEAQNTLHRSQAPKSKDYDASLELTPHMID